MRTRQEILVTQSTCLSCRDVVTVYSVDMRDETTADAGSPAGRGAAE
jgi:hypothetical protein